MVFELFMDCSFINDSLSTHYIQVSPFPPIHPGLKTQVQVFGGFWPQRVLWWA